MIKEILNWPEQVRKEYFEKADKFLEYCFNPVTDESKKEFIKGII